MFKCRICENSTNNTTYEVKEMLFGFRDKFEYFQCAKCNCLQISDIPSDMSKYYPSNYYSYRHREPYIRKGKNLIIKMIRRLRDNYAICNSGIVGRLIYSMFPNEYLKTIIDLHFPFQNRRSFLNKATDILDVGCGYGDFLWVLKEVGFNNLLGIVPYIKENITYSNGLKILKKIIQDLSGEFNLIMFHHSFEHLPNPLATLQCVSRLLARQSTCLIRIPIVDSYAWEYYRENWFALDPPRHFFLYSIKSIQILANKSGLNLKHIVYDSTESNLWASEQYARNIPFESGLSYSRNKQNHIFTDKEIKIFKEKAIVLNREKKGDQAAFYLEKP